VRGLDNDYSSSHQEARHRKLTYQQEVVALLKKQGVEFDPRLAI
jgi:hypothetical protein